MWNPAAIPTPVFARAANDHLHTLKKNILKHRPFSAVAFHRKTLRVIVYTRRGGVEINQPIVPEHLVSAVIAATAWGHPAQTRVVEKVYIMPWR